MKLKLKKDVCLRTNSIFQKNDLVLTLNHTNVSIQKAFDALVEGIEEEHLEAIVDSGDTLVHFYFYIEELKKNGFLQYETPLMELIPFNGTFSPPSTVKGVYSLSRFTLIRVHEGNMVLETPLSPVRVRLTEKGFPMVHALCQPMSVEEIIFKFPHFTRNELQDTLCLLEAGHLITSALEETSPMAQWEFHDLFFHSRSRLGRIDTPYGGTFRFKGTLPSLPAVKHCHHLAWVNLPQPQEELRMTLEEAIQERKSLRDHGIKPIQLNDLGEFLWRCARVKSKREMNDEEYTSRPYPGGGARYELEIYLVVTACEGLAPGVYHYHPLEHRLGKISDLNEEAHALLQDACRSSGKKENPHILFMVAARFQRVAWKYQSMAYALVLKDVGILIQTMYLVATAMKLAPCALGGGDSDLFCKLVGTSYLEETSVGEFILGSLL